MAEETAPIKTLSDAVSAKYNGKGITTGKMILPQKFGGSSVDFTEMTIEQADALVAKYPLLPYLEAKTKTAPAAAAKT